MSDEDYKFKKKLTFDISKFMFQNELELKTPSFFGFF